MKLIAALVLLLALSACSLPVFFRVPIVQGNIVTANQVAKLKKGMTKKQVAYVLGTPLIKSPFESDRWDYVFYYRNPNAHVRQSKLDLYFVNGKLSDIEGDEEYTAHAFKGGKQSGSGGTTSGLGTPLETTSAQGSESAPSQTTQPNPGASNNVPGANPSMPTENQPTTQNPLPHTGPALPGQPN